MLQPAHKELEQFLARWRPVIGEDDYAAFVEGVRRLSVACKIQFREGQLTDHFEDKTGDGFLQRCKESFEPRPGYNDHGYNVEEDDD